MQIIESRIEINAPLEIVWQVLLDFDKYGQWNPFTPKVVCDLTEGSPVVLHVDMAQNGKVQIQKETLLWYKPKESIAWGIKSVFPVRTERAQNLSAFGNKTIYYTYDKFWGVLVPLVMFLYREKIQAGFDGVAKGLKERAEWLHANQGL